MKRLILGAVLALSLAALPACESLKLGEHGATVKLAISYATMKYVDQAGPGANIQRAARVASFANQAMNAIEGEGFTLDAFKSHILELIPADLDTADKVLALALIDVIAQELQLRIGDGVLTPETRVKAKQVLTWIVDATAFYSTPT